MTDQIADVSAREQHGRDIDREKILLAELANEPDPVQKEAIKREYRIVFRKEPIEESAPAPEPRKVSIKDLVAKYSSPARKTAAEELAPPTPEPAAQKVADKPKPDMQDREDRPMLTSRLGPSKIDYERSRQERLGIPHALGDIYQGGRQLVTHLGEKMGLADKGAGAKVDKEAMEREKAYQEATPLSSGTARVATTFAPAMLTGGTSIPAGIAAAGAMSLAAPVTDTTEKSYGQQKMTDVPESMALAVVPNVIQSGFKWALRGGKEAAVKLQQNIWDYKRAGIDRPTLGQVSEGGATKGAGATADKMAEEVKSVQSRVDNIADKIHAARTPEEAGNIISSGIRGDKVRGGGRQGGWMDNFAAGQKTLYDKADNLLPPDTKTFLPNTLSALKKFSTPSKTAPATTGALMDKKVAELYGNLKDDAGKARSLPLEDVKAIRTRIGELIDASVMDPKINIKQAKEIYAALSHDMADVAKRKGPKAYEAMLKANEFAAAGHELMETHLQPVINSGIKQEVFSAATSGTSKGAERIREVLGALEPVQADAVRSVMMRELGREGENFNPLKFFQNWSKMHGDAKTELFGKSGANVRSSIDKIAEVSATLSKQGSTLNDLRNYAMSHGIEGETAAAAYLTHRSGVAATLIGIASGGFIIGRSIENPVIMKWLAQSVTKTPAQVPAALSALYNRTRDLPADQQAEVDEYISAVKGAMGNMGEQ